MKSHMAASTLVYLALLIIPAMAVAQKADYVFTGGKVYTVNEKQLCPRRTTLANVDVNLVLFTKGRNR